MHSLLSSVALLASTAFAQDGWNSGNQSTEGIFPGTVYPGYESDNPVVVAGALFNQTSPPKYPSPWGEGLGDWAAAYSKARAFVSQLTLPEKVNLTMGTGWELERCVGQTGSIPRLGFRGLCLQDSPVGLRDTDFNSVFPAGVNVAATWDRKLAYTRGRAMGKEHYGKGSDMQLGPVAGPLGRAPEGARNWEGFSPDPVLTGQLFAESIKGIQSAGVMTSAKHYIAYEQDHFRVVDDSTGYGFNITASVSSNLDDETLHELYLWPFADGVKAGATTIMCSYNQVNNSQSCQNSYILNYLLKGELGFQGAVVSDWAGTHSGVSAVLAGLDMTMPGDTDYDSGYSYFGGNLTIAVLNGTVPAWRVDDMAVRILAGFFYVGRNITRDPISFSSWTTDTYGWESYYVGEAGLGWGQVNEHVDVRAGGDHAAIIRDIGARSTVLLKNVNNTLPLTGKEKITTVFGADAGVSLDGPNSCTDRGCDNGTLGMAWGSGSSNFAYLISPDFAIQNEVLSHASGAYESSLDNYNLDAVATLARGADEDDGVAIFFANSDAGEWYIEIGGNLGERNNLTFWQGADEALAAVAGTCSNTILVVHSVGPVLLEKWQNHPNVTAILWAGIPGEQSGNSIADVLYGRVNPGAKLPFTIGKDRKDYGTDILYNVNQDPPQVAFTEGVFIDYRAFDKHNETPTYEFGYGLSYTNFSYSNLQIQKFTNASDYEPFTGYTIPAPSYGNFSNSSVDYTYPSDIRMIPYFMYPWLNSSNLSAASGDPDYGKTDFIPANALNGSAQPYPKAGGAPGGNPRLYDVLYHVTATITNTGKVAGEEVPQLYISRGGPYDPPKELRGFDRLSIEPNCSVTFTVDVTRRDIGSWSTVEQDWYVRNTTKKVWVGSSSRNLPLEGLLP
ncbi:putative beta-glucosidase 1 precursor [Teratosphaeria nubilosa]|uniref:beta-glucosidase n=1 Tax=Teratosphaeria nubilosa TaxID=161662 RepID=A0A6G1KXW6_9PEZI|nr:putative beta-glucosidase 1 precursor [Teratosphaeria nubilosa]